MKSRNLSSLNRNQPKSLSDMMRGEVMSLPDHERLRVSALVEHIIALCECHGTTGEISLGVLTALVAEEAKNNKLV